MTQEEKQLLLQDLCARLTYGIKCTTKLTGYNDVYVVQGVYEDNVFIDCPVYEEGDDEWMIESIIPFLRPMSSMTEEEKKTLWEELDKDTEILWENIDTQIINVYKGRCYRGNPVYHEIDFLNKNHFDWRGLIPMGLALEAPEGMYGENC